MRVSSEADKVAAKAKGIIRREEAETLKVMKLAEAEGETARITAENSRTDVTVAAELEKAKLAALPGIIGEMVKPAEKIKGISINHISGMDRGSDKGGNSAVGQTLDAMLDMAVTLPAMKKIGDSIGMNLDGLLPEDTSKD